MKNLLFILCMLTTTVLTAQSTITWVGGTPGNETNWHEARNWSPQQVPDAYSNVVIKDLQSGHHAQPVIKSKAEVLSIEIQSGASLKIVAQAELIVDGMHSYSQGIMSYGGQLINDGYIQLLHVDEAHISQLSSFSSGNGTIVLNDEVSGEAHIAGNQ